MDFQPVVGSHISRATAVLLGNAFKRIRNEGPLTEETLLEYASPRTSEIHDKFEWNDAKAAHTARLAQAGYYLRSVAVVIVDEENEEQVRVRAVQTEGPDRGYDFTTRIMKNPERRKNLLAQALAEFKSWKTRWETLEELGEIFAAADKVSPRK